MMLPYCIDCLQGYLMASPPACRAPRRLRLTAAAPTASCLRPQQQVVLCADSAACVVRQPCPCSADNTAGIVSVARVFLHWNVHLLVWPGAGGHAALQPSSPDPPSPDQAAPGEEEEPGSSLDAPLPDQASAEDEEFQSCDGTGESVHWSWLHHGMGSTSVMRPGLDCNLVRPGLDCNLVMRAASEGGNGGSIDDGNDDGGAVSSGGDHGSDDGDGQRTATHAANSGRKRPAPDREHQGGCLHATCLSQSPNNLQSLRSRPRFLHQPTSVARVHAA